MRAATVLLALALVGCTGGSRVVGSTPTSVPAGGPPSTTGAGEAEAPAPATTETTVVASTVVTTVPSAAPALPGWVAVASDRGVELVGPDGVVTPVVSGPVGIAFQTGERGWLLQPAAGPDGPPIGRFDQDGVWAVIATGAAGERLILHGGAEVGGTPAAVFTRRWGIGHPESEEEFLEVVPMSGASPQRLAVVGGWQWGAQRISFGGGLFAVAAADHATDWVLFLAEDGERIDVPTVPGVGCRDHLSCPRRAVLSPDGTTLAFLQGADPERRLVVFDLVEGRDVSSSPVPPDHEITFLDFDGAVAALSLAGPEGEPVPGLVLEVGSGSWSELPVAGTVTVAHTGTGWPEPMELPSR